MAIIILVKLLCAHLISDFILQTDSINKGKRESGIKGLSYQLLHSITHACIAYLLVADWSCWLIPVIIFISHFIIDLLKCWCCKDSLSTFLVDQFLHITVIGVLWLSLYGEEIELSYFNNLCSVKVWLIVMGYMLMLRPSSILLGKFLRQWTPSSSNSQSLPKAGQWIGYIERILILTFVFVGSFEGIGFLLAAKSVFRFGELNKAKEIQTTEYVLIGTLASFTIAILTGLAITRLFNF
jgi:hypothetical protein